MLIVDPRLDQLKQAPLFSDFSEEELGEVLALTAVRRFRKGTIIFHENEPGAAFFLVKSGRIKVFKLAEDGRELILGIFGPNAIFGDVPVFDGGPYPASAAALTDAEVYAIARTGFEELVKDHPEIALKVIRVLGKRLRQAHNLVRDLALKNVPQRLSGLLIRLADEYGRPSDGGTLLDLPLSRQDMAQLIGISRETLIRELTKFAKAGLIRLDKRRITIADPVRLQIWSKV